jgi:hypothetical protein
MLYILLKIFRSLRKIKNEFRLRYQLRNGLCAVRVG